MKKKPFEIVYCIRSGKQFFKFAKTTKCPCCKRDIGIVWY